MILTIALAAALAAITLGLYLEYRARAALAAHAIRLQYAPYAVRYAQSRAWRARARRARLYTVLGVLCYLGTLCVHAARA